MTFFCPLPILELALSGTLATSGERRTTPLYVAPWILLTGARALVSTYSDACFYASCGRGLPPQYLAPPVPNAPAMSVKALNEGNTTVPVFTITNAANTSSAALTAIKMTGEWVSG